MVKDCVPVARAGDADIRVPLTRRVVYVGYENRGQKNWSGSTLFLFLIGVFIVFGFCTLTWYYFHEDDSCSSVLGDDSIFHSLDSIDPDVDPCHDFYSYACGRWNASRSKKYTYMSAVEETNVRNLLRLESYLKCTSTKELTGWGRFMMETYETCERERKGSVHESETVRFVRDMARPLLQDESGVNNLDDALRRTHHKLLESGVFSWDVTLDLKNGSIIQTLKLSPPRKPWNGVLDFPSNQHQMEYIMEILLLLGGGERVVLRTTEELADFIVMLKTQIYVPKPSSKFIQRKRFTLSELDFLLDFIDFGAYFQQDSLSDSVSVIVEDWGYFSWLQLYLNGGRRNVRAMIKFLTWSAVEFFVPYMPEEFSRIRRKYTNITAEKARDFVEGSQVCVNAVKKSMNFAASTFFMDKTLDRVSRELADDIVRHVKLSYRDFLHTLQSRHHPDRKWLIGLDAVFRNIEIGVPAHLQKIYQDPVPFTLNNKSFPHRLLTALNFTKTRMVSYIEEVPLAVLFRPNFLQLNGVFVNLPLLIVNLGILSPPLFDPKQSLSSNYAGLGFVVAHELAHSVDYLAINSSPIRSHLKTVTRCLHKQYGDNNRPVDVTSEDFADNVGIQVAYNAFLDHAKRCGVSPDDIDKRNFFVHYGQILCEDGASFSLDINAHHSPYKHRVNMPLSNFPVFSDIFSCSRSSPMNIINKCDIS